MSRVAMKDVVLQDGTRLPRGTMVAVTSYAMHHDTALLSGADTFDPFRFARMRGAEEGPGQGAKHQLTSTSPEFLAFAHGRHAWYAPFSAVYFVRGWGLTRLAARGGTSRRRS